MMSLGILKGSVVLGLDRTYVYPFWSPQVNSPFETLKPSETVQAWTLQRESAHFILFFIFIFREGYRTFLSFDQKGIIRA